MHLSFPRAIMAGLAAVPFASASVSLSSFTPSIDNLPSPCQGAYTTVIEGCQPSDFQVGVRCSSACVQGLIKINNLVTSQCADVDVGETSIIGVFLLGKGIDALCPGVTVTTISSASSPQTSTSAAQVSSSQEAQSSSSSSPAPSSTGEVIQADPNPTTLINSPNQPVEQPTADDTTTAAPRQTADLQKSNKDSGGGSPFDVVATGSSTQLAFEDFFKPTLIALAICIGLVL